MTEDEIKLNVAIVETFKRLAPRPDDGWAERMSKKIMTDNRTCDHDWTATSVITVTEPQTPENTAAPMTRKTKTAHVWRCRKCGTKKVGDE